MVIAAGRAPLDGVRVLDLSRNLAGPYAGLLLADLGADVIKVEPPGGDPSRGLLPAAQGCSLYFASVNRNKRSVVLDLKRPEGRDAFLGLVRTSDVVLDSFRPGVMARLGLDYESLRAVAPGIIACSLSGYGSTGPDRELPAYDVCVQARAGIMSVTGDPNGPPVRAGISVSDEAAGLVAALGIVAALFSRARTGLGQQLDIGMLDCSVSLLTYLGAYVLNGAPAPGRQGAGHPSVAPWGTYRARDGALVLAVFGEHFWRELCRAIGRPDLEKDPRFRTNADRVRHREALDPLLEGVLSTRDTAEWLAAFREAGIPAAPVNDLGAVFVDSQVRARDMILTVGTPGGGEVRLIGSPIKSSAMAERSSKPVPGLGEHTYEVLEAAGLLPAMPGNGEATR